ncbi:RNA 2',3'-cyclic phosphodiesterase [Ornithinimicrobium ciconiae]|uniref:RNA 2',3'-cyclic phosphodiesterase n=1 Tax=Ornithinimicrobium ciconiae TaxID=2594265 RepID=A0A516G5X2_9MICO|nr:RNA 2',3'-cyclic phosphodiesterase [Ornithinimicrobium ciconiae]QDO86916.1 RNA 2',3'-cyclic phosphodiesterase [Ornithinimicrobium ciconiae]
MSSASLTRRWHDERMRAFFAVLPPPEVLEDLAAYLEPRRDADTERTWRWTRTHHLHLTLAFLGELPEHREEELVTAAKEWAARQHPVRMSWGRSGAFPDPGGAKVIWIGVTPEDAGRDLSAWSRALRDLSSHAGADVDGQRFTPHITVARSPRRVPAGRWVQALDAYESPEFLVEEVALVQSHLGGPGRSVRYEIRHTLPLGA